ncbi:MAG: 1-deoxy-D-xylulose-5-phosphate synthase [Candidatus Marinimicrobia bacterium]|nr:1-deoxy-D-xylulose-5-phosphate synthase [Candidatus Neomarinimicrobiota bacterium]
MKYKILKKIDTPKDIKKLSIDELQILADELRDYIINVISKTGGHLAPSLGVVELTIALLYVFELPDDKIIWDVGHQTYSYKVLTGRREKLKTIRKYGGISGFLKRSESEYDAFGAGHASTSISSALGISAANDLLNITNKVIAVIGDGALTGGLAWEGFNNIGRLKKQLMVILNDNEMSISRNVGGISRYLNRIVTGSAYNQLRNNVWKFTGRFNGEKHYIRSGIKRILASAKKLIVPNIIFDEMGLRYFGPIDGHNIPQLVDAFTKLKKIKTPILVHVLTVKGKGLPEAEADPTKYHGIPGEKIKVEIPKKKMPTYTEVFGKTIIELAKKDPKVVGITAAMKEGTGLVDFAKKFPKRFFDVGIAEGHAVTFAAGLATNGIKPVVSIYSSFLQRAIDNIIHDVSLQKLPVIFCCDRAGIVGADGPTHHGNFDLSYLSMIPNIVLSAPKDGNELRSLMHLALKSKNKPFFIRYPRDKSVRYDPKNRVAPLKLGSWEYLKKGKKVAIIAIGTMVREAEKALKILSSSNIDATLINARFICPYDKIVLNEVVKDHKNIFTIEEGNPNSGLENLVSRFMQNNESKSKLHSFSIPDEYITHGERSILIKQVELDSENIAKRIIEIVK